MNLRRPPALFLATLLSLSSCQWAGDTKAARVPFSDLKQRVSDAHSSITSAVRESAFDRVPDLDRALNAELDAVTAQSGAINLIDREHLAINVATIHRCLTAMDQYAHSGDFEDLRAQMEQLQPTITEILDLLDRAERTTTTK